MSARWLDDFRIALIEQQYQTLASLCETMPVFEEIDEVQEASALVTQALNLSISEQKSIQKTMIKIKKNIHFIAQEQQKPTLSTLS